MTSIIVAILGSGALSSVISALVSMANRKSKLKKLEKDTVRLQLLFLMKIMPEEEQELMTLGEYYFDTLKADWYLSTLFDKHLKARGIERPAWFKGGESS